MMILFKTYNRPTLLVLLSLFAGLGNSNAQTDDAADHTLSLMVPTVIYNDQNEAQEVLVDMFLPKGVQYGHMDISLAVDRGRERLHTRSFSFTEDEHGAHVLHKGFKFYVFDEGHFMIPLDIPPSLREDCHFLEIVAHTQTGETLTYNKEF